MAAGIITEEDAVVTEIRLPRDPSALSTDELAAATQRFVDEMHRRMK